jgi:hypothetical protein
MSTEGERAASLALASARLPSVLAHGTRGLLNALWLGVLSERSLRALDRRYYDSAGVYRTAGWNEKGLFPWELRSVEDHFRQGARVLVPACGGGREVLALLEAGFDAAGYEPHPDLAAYARSFLAERGHRDRIEEAKPDEFPSAGGPCDAVLVGWGAYSLMHGRAARVAFLGGARHQLPTGGPVLISFFDRDADTRELRWTRAAANALRRLRGADALELGDTLAPNLVHIFSRAQLSEEAAAAGFDIASYEVAGHADGATRYAYAVLQVQ